MYWKPPKALRWLRSLRHFVKGKRFSVMCVQLDGQTLLVMKSGKLNLPPDADLTLSMNDPYPQSDATDASQRTVKATS